MFPSAAIDPRELRNALGRFATGVAVVTTRATGGMPIGLTVNSVVAVSLEPPLVAWSLATRSDGLSAFLAALLRAQRPGRGPGGHLPPLRGRASAPPLRRGRLDTGPGGVPLLDGCLARLECRTVRRIEAGDHWLLLGAPERLAYAAAGRRSSSSPAATTAYRLPPDVVPHQRS